MEVTQLETMEKAIFIASLSTEIQVSPQIIPACNRCLLKHSCVTNTARISLAAVFSNKEIKYNQQ